MEPTKNKSFQHVVSASSPMHQRLFVAHLAALAVFASLAFGKISSTDVPIIDTTMPADIPAEIISDWKTKDKVDTGYSAAIAEIKTGLSAQYASQIDTGSTETQYLKACHLRRVARIQPFSRELKRLLCSRHYNEGGAVSGYLEDLNNDTVILDSVKKITASRGSRYKAGAAFLVLNFDDYYPAPSIMLEDKTGVLRDPCVSFDGKRIAFAWSKDNDGYHIFEIDAGKPDSVRQLTCDLPDYNVSDYEPCYLPNEDIIFNSSRCFQGHSFATNLVSNLYIMNKDGKYRRRICYDQAHDFHPSVMSNGRIMFSRWEFNDRHPGYAFGVFTMNPDGALQNEYFGNQCSWPNTFPTAREIPDSRGKFLSIIGQVMASVYQGDLVLVDPAKGRNTVDAVQYIAPKRDINGTENRKFQDPFPLSETWFLISYAENPGSTAKFRLYLMDIDGNRELLAWDANQSISQPVPLCARKAPRISCQADYSKTNAEVTMTNAYYGTGMDSTVIPGTVKKIRVIALEYRMYPAIGSIGIQSYMPLARVPGSNESKRILGEMKVESDGSAAFIVPARTPFYVQLIDGSGCMIQSMRSWMTLQPGEKFDCYGCHEDKNIAPPPVGTPIARVPKALEPFYDVADGYFHYPAVIQPILDANCVSCHNAGDKSGLDLSGEKIWTGDLKDGNQKADRFWCRSYLNLTDPKKGLVDFISSLSAAEGQKPDSVGAKHSRLIAKLRQRSGGMSGVELSEKDMAKLCAWIDLCIPHGGKYSDDMKPEHAQFYENRLLLRKQEEDFETQNIAEFVNSGGYKAKEYGGTFNASIYQVKIPHSGIATDGENLEVRFSRCSGRLFMKLPAPGIVTIVDLKGRRVLAADVMREEYVQGKGWASRVPSVGVSAGLYIATFKGKTVSRSRVVPIL